MIPPTEIVTTLKKTALVLATLVIVPIGALYYFFGEEDYYPEPGSIDFYLKLSPVIRNLPVIAPQQTPAYYGSIGDGAKASQSSVSYITREKNEQILVSTLNNYLHQNRFTLDPSSGRADQAFYSSDKKVLHEAAFTKAGGNESVVFQIYSLPKTGAQEINVTHFE